MAGDEQSARIQLGTGAKVVVVGLDGATWVNLLPLVERGAMPFLGGLLETGGHGVLESTLPCVTPPAWGSFVTGTSPARHGVLDFTERMDSDTFSFVSFKNLAVPKLWDVLTHCRRRSVFLGIPFTYPPEPLNGIFVPGPPIPRQEGLATHPPELAAEIAARIPGYTPELRYGKRSEILDEIYRATRNRRELAQWLMSFEEWDFFMVTFIAPDRLHHKLWHKEKIVAEYYRHLDEVLAALLEGLDRSTYVIFMSDHGFTSMRTKFFPNQWLASRGYLKARFVRRSREQNARTLMPTPRRQRSAGKVYGWRRPLRCLPGWKDAGWIIDRAGTQAFASFGHFPGVFVNLRGRYEGGSVAPGAEYEEVRESLIRDLETIIDPGTGQPLFKRVARREELFDGDHLERMPDVISEVSDPAVRLRSNLGLGRFFVDFDKPKSYHAPDGIVLVKGPGIAAGRRIEGCVIQDVAPLVLYLMGLPRLSTMDGRLPRGFFNDDFEGWKREEVVIDAAETGFVPGAHTFSEAEQEKIGRQLEALGYY